MCQFSRQRGLLLPTDPEQGYTFVLDSWDNIGYGDNTMRALKFAITNRMLLCTHTGSVIIAVDGFVVTGEGLEFGAKAVRKSRACSNGGHDCSHRRSSDV